MAPVGKVGEISAGTSAWRKVIANPFRKRKRPCEEYVPDENGELSGESINSIIEAEIIPKLLMAHSGGGVSNEKTKRSTINPSDAHRFASLPLQLEAAGLMEEVDAFLEQGACADTICLDLLAPAARRLGEMWEQDECDFVDVTMGLWRLQEVMREVARRSPPVVRAASAPRSALFAPMPGDQHSFGAIMIEDVFSRAGWQSQVIPRAERRELLDVVAHKSFDVVGLTLSRDCPSSAVSKLVKAIRSVSANPNIAVLIGGRMVNQNPAIVAEVGADGTGADARAALQVAERLVLTTPLAAQLQR